MTVFKGLDADELERQYFLRGLRPEYEVTDIPGWIERSKAFAARSPGARFDLAYGPAERNRLDFFPATRGSEGFVLYIHGGYWQRGDKSVYSLLAEPLVNRGISVALMNYQMCPDVRISEIPPQARLAAAWLWRHAEELGITRDNFNIMGHSAGGHLTAEMMATDWSREGDDLPREMIHAGIALSGIFEFEPILYCRENKGLRMDAEEARAVSTIFRGPVTDAPQLIGYGANEPSDMRRQSIDYVAAFGDQSRNMESFEIADADHFEVVDVLSDDSSALFARVMAFLTR